MKSALEHLNLSEPKTHKIKEFFNSRKGFLCVNLSLLSILIATTAIYGYKHHTLSFFMLIATIIFAINTTWMTWKIAKIEKEIEKTRKERDDTERAMLIATRDWD